MAEDGRRWQKMAEDGRRWQKMAAVLAVTVLQSGVFAQAWANLTEPAEYVSVEVGDSGWTLFPIITMNDDFIGFFGYLPPELVVGNNVSLLWLVPDSGDGSWSMYGWLDDILKAASDFLDDLSGRDFVLADTGLNIFFHEDAVQVEPTSMPFGIAITDSTAPIIEASQDPVVAELLVAIGAGGAAGLTKATNVQPTNCVPAIIDNGTNGISELDMKLAMAARSIQEMMIVWPSTDILDSIDATGYNQDPEAWCCWPVTYTVYGAWGPWTCTGGPIVGVGSCTWTGCTHCRPTFVVTVNWNCVTGSFAGPMDCPPATTEERLRHPESGCPLLP